MSAKKSLLKILNENISHGMIAIKDGTDEIIIGNKYQHSENFVKIEIKNADFYQRVLAYGNLGLGESYMNDSFLVLENNLEDFISILLKNNLNDKIKMDWLLFAEILKTRLKGALRNQWKNVQYHYDIGEDLFDSFLDSTQTYSCGYALEFNNSLEQLQTNKFERICKKLDLHEGETLLDIGCGNGGLLVYAVKNFGIEGLGITNSNLHFQGANVAIRNEGIENKTKVLLEDYQNLNQKFDKIVSVGMLEHVPRKKYDLYFNKIKNNLHSNGKGLIHFVGANSYINKHDPFIQKYIFPFSNQPRLSEISNSLEQNMLYIIDVENMIRHYGYTASAWLKRFRESVNRLKEKYPISFLKMWEYYLCCCCAAALYSDSALYQILFTNDHRSEISLKRV